MRPKKVFGRSFGDWFKRNQPDIQSRSQSSSFRDRNMNFIITKNIDLNNNQFECVDGVDGFNIVEGEVEGDSFESSNMKKWVWNLTNNKF